MKTKLTALLVLLSSVSFTQENLPILIEKDTTISFNKKVWVQSERSELQQRHRELKLNQKLSAVKNSVKTRRDTLNNKMLTLLENIDKLKIERDSVVEMYEDSSSAVKKDLDKALSLRDNRIKFLQRKYETYLVKYLFYKKWMIRLVLLSVGEFVVILVII